MSFAIQVKPSFLNLPTEILIYIYCQLPSFSDVFHFTATCKQFNIAYCQNTNIIYNNISRKCIQCQYHARQLLANQKGIPVDATTPITPSDVRQICQNACTVTECLKKYNSDYIAPQCSEDGMHFAIPSIIPLIQSNALHSVSPSVIDSLAVILVHHIYDVLKSPVSSGLFISFGGYVFSIQREENFN